MKKFIGLFMALLIFVGLPVYIYAATNSAEMRASTTVTATTVVSNASYAKVCSVSITQDTVGNTLAFVGGEIWLRSNEQVNFVVGTDTTSGGVPQLVVAAALYDTTVADIHKYPCYFGKGGPESYVVPFSFVQHFDTDSIAGAIILYLWARSGDAYNADLGTNTSIVPVLRNVYMHGITNMADQP